MAYKPKYRIGRADEPLKGHEVMKIIDGINQETRRQEFWHNCTLAFIIAFSIFAILIMLGVR